MSDSCNKVFRFGPFTLDAAEQRLLRDGAPIPLSPKPFNLLVLLVSHVNHVLEKSELMAALWPDCNVEEANLTVAVSALRKALGAAGGDYIQTVPKRGYRFTGDVVETVVSPAPAATPSPAPPGGTSVAGARWSPALRVALLLLLVAAGAAIALVRPFSAAANHRKPIAVAVLPFHLLEGQTAQTDLGVAMADALITKLSNIHEIVVRPTGAVVKYSQHGADLLKVGRELSVDSVVDGTVQRVGDRIRVNVQVVSVPNGVSLWAATLDEAAGNLFSLQDSISERVADALVPRVTRQERLLLTKKLTSSAEAYDAYQRGRYDSNQRTAESLNNAIEHFNRAVALDPGFARAYVGLADCENLLADYQAVRPKAVAPLARAAALQALQLESDLAEAHASLAFVRYHFDWDWAGAEREYKRAITLNDHYATAHHWYGLFLATMGRFDESLRELARARELDPSSLIVSTNIGWVQYLLHRYDEAIDQYQKVLTNDPDFAPAHFKLTWVMEQKDRYGDAFATLARGLELNGQGELASSLGRTYAESGYVEQLKRFRASMIEESQRGYVDPYNIASISVELNDAEQAILWLETSYRERDYWLPAIGVEPAFDRTRNDPRFKDLLRRMGLSDALSQLTPAGTIATK